MNRDIARAMLEASGHVVDPVAGGAEAVRERRYGLVLMDVQMPRMDGLSARQRGAFAHFRRLSATFRSSA